MKKKIILFIDNLGSGGAQRQIVNLGILLKEAGYDVNILMYSNKIFYKEILVQYNIPIMLINGNNYLLRILRICFYLKRSHADIVITFLETPGFLACLSKIGGVKWKLITSERSAKMETFINKKNRVYNIFERFSDVKVCNSQNAKKMWEKYYPQYRNKYYVIYNPILINLKDNKFNKQKNNKKLKITVVASYQKLKNPLRVIEALALLNNEEKKYIEIDWYGRKEVTIGNNIIYDEAVKLIEKYNLQNVIHLHGETNQIYSIMNKSDVVGLFSTVEGLPNVICEGMMLGKPIIMSRVSDYEVLIDGNGVLCDANCPMSICEALRELINSSKEKLLEMGEISKNKADNLFSTKKILNQWISLIEKLTK